jgi:hypothetical protein
MKNHIEKIERYLKGVVLPEYESHLHRQRLRQEVVGIIERKQNISVRNGKQPFDAITRFF